MKRAVPEPGLEAPGKGRKRLICLKKEVPVISLPGSRGRVGKRGRGRPLSAFAG